MRLFRLDENDFKRLRYLNAKLLEAAEMKFSTKHYIEVYKTEWYIVGRKYGFVPETVNRIGIETKEEHFIMAKEV